MILYKTNNSSLIQITKHLHRMDLQFTPALSSYVNIDDYANKLFEKAFRFEAYHSNQLIGLIAGYHRKELNDFFISNYSVEETFQGMGIAKLLLSQIEKEFEDLTMITLEVMKVNDNAKRFYSKLGLIEIESKMDSLILMKKCSK